MPAIRPKKRKPFSLVITPDQVERCRAGFDAVRSFLASQPFTIGDFVDDADLEGWYQLECLLHGTEYKRSDYFDDEENHDAEWETY